MLIVRGMSARPTSPVALTIGNFDGVHRGHQALLKRLKYAANKRGLPACVMTFEPQPREFFAPDAAPARLTSLREKAELLSKFGIDRLHVFRFDRQFASLSPDDFITRVLCQGLQTRWLLVGDDFRFGVSRGGDLSLLQKRSGKCGFEVAAMETVTVGGLRVSSTAIRSALASGDLARAETLLGHSYSMSGRVVHGDKLGESLGFPTANLRIARNRPALSGIFAVQVSGLGTKPVNGVASLGVRPTVSKENKPLLEVHLFDCASRLYGVCLSVTFLHKLREEHEYPDLETLRSEIARDVENAKNYFSRATQAADAPML
jgi:riboflavin kinase / FMN adenylyltransferase